MTEFVLNMTSFDLNMTKFGKDMTGLVIKHDFFWFVQNMTGFV